MKTLTEMLWGQRARFSYLLLGAAFLLFAYLGGKEIWTQEHRWADIVSGMFFRHDFLHPYLGLNSYYDKPLLSYWLIAISAKLLGSLSVTALRVPSALAGLLAIWSIYRLGCQIKDKQLGLLAGWMLLTTFFFVFWARTSSADMLNMAGSLLAVAWYIEKREQTRFRDYVVFFLIIALTCLCKGLIGAVIPALAVMTDIALQKTWRRHLLHKSFWLAMLPAFIVYLFPFWASSHFGGKAYDASGLYLVYRENVLRYFQPFDHRGPIYIYFIYLPIYLLPWTFFFFPALLSLRSRWQGLSPLSRWIAWSTLAIFLFLTLSGSRRSYYVLPLMPFAILLTADWLRSLPLIKQQMVAKMAVGLFALFFILLDILPTWYYQQVGAGHFATLLKQEAEKVQPWNNWNIVMLDAESKLSFYLNLPPHIKNYQVREGLRSQVTRTSLLQHWPILVSKPKNTIFISRKIYEPLLKESFAGYQVVEMSPPKLAFLLENNNDMPIAFIPVKMSFQNQ